MTKNKRIFLLSGISVLATTAIIAVAASCTNEQKVDDKKVDNQAKTNKGLVTNTIRNNNPLNKNKFNVTLHSSVLNYVDQKHNLSLNVSSEYARKVVEVELKPNSSNRSSIKSTKVASDTNGDTTVVFSGLEHNKSYYVSAVNIYEDLRKTNAIVSNSYLENVLVVKTPANNKEQSLNKQIESDDKQSSGDQIKQNEQPNPNDQKDSGSTTETPTPNKQMNSDDKNGSDDKTHNQNNNESSTNNLDSNSQTSPVPNPEQNNSVPKLNNSNPGFDPNVQPDLNALLEQFKKQRELADRLASNRPASKVVENLKINEDEAYKKIKNRSFAIGFNSVDYAKESNGGINDSVVSFEPTGTGWLLDYAWKNGEQNSDELMLYIATNAHVYKRAFNAVKDDEKHRNKFPEYFTQKDQKDAKIDSFVLAIPKREANLDAIESGTSYGTSNDLQYFINTKDNESFSLEKGSKQITFDDSKVFENPRTVFVALNIFDEQNNDKLIDKLNNHAQRKYIAKDFAVFGLKVKYKELEQKAKDNNKYKLLLDHINNATKSVDEDIKKFSDNKHPNHDQGSVPYLSLDYPSIWADQNKPESEKLNKDKYKIDDKTSLNTQRAYIAGFPGMNGKQMLWRNYPKNSNIPNDAFSRSSFFKGQQIEHILDSNTTASGFGFNAFVDYSSIYFGASGSLVVNEYGLPIGIYSTITRVDNEKDVSKRGGFTFLVQVHDDNEKGPAHNLIDGSDKDKFPKQFKSYRENLKWLSEQENSEFKGFNKTAIFKSGV